MSELARIEGTRPFNAFAAYERERDYSRRVEALLSRSLALLEMETKRRALRGEDVAHLSAFIAEARAVEL